MLSLIPFTLLPTAEYDRIVATLGVLGLDASSTPDSARAMIGAFKSEGKAEAHRERVDALRADLAEEEREAIRAEGRMEGPALRLREIAKACADALGEPLSDPLSWADLTALVNGVCGRLVRLERFAEAVEAKQAQPPSAPVQVFADEVAKIREECMASGDWTKWKELSRSLPNVAPGKPTETRRADIALDDVRLMVAGALFEPTAPTQDPNDIVRLVRRLVEAHTAVKTTLLEAAKASAMGLLADMDRAKTDPEGVIREAAGMAAQGRCALGVLDRLSEYSSGMRSGNEADALAYTGDALQCDQDGRKLAAAAARAVVLVNRLLIALDDENKTGKENRDLLYELIEKHQTAGSEMANLLNTAQDQLDRLGVPRLPAPLDKFIALRIQVMAAMRERIVASEQ